MEILLSILSLFFVIHYSALLFTGAYKDFLYTIVFNKVSMYNKVLSYIEIAYLAGLFLSSVHDIQRYVFGIVLTGWLLIWPFTVSADALLADRRKAYLFYIVTIVMYCFLTFINTRILWESLT